MMTMEFQTIPTSDKLHEIQLKLDENLNQQQKIQKAQAKLEALIQEKDDVIEAQDSEIAELKTELAELRSNVALDIVPSDSETENLFLRQQIAKLKAQNTELIKSNMEKSARIQQLEIENANLKQERDALVQQMKELEDRMKGLEKKQEKMEEERKGQAAQLEIIVAIRKNAVWDELEKSLWKRPVCYGNLKRQIDSNETDFVENSKLIKDFDASILLPLSPEKVAKNFVANISKYYPPLKPVIVSVMEVMKVKLSDTDFNKVESLLAFKGEETNKARLVLEDLAKNKRLSATKITHTFIKDQKYSYRKWYQYIF